MFKINKSSLLCMLLIVALVMMMVAPAAMARSSQEKESFIIGFHDFPGQAEMRLLDSYGAEITREFSIIPAITVNLPARAVNALQRSPLVDYVEPNIQMFALGASADSWGIDRVRAPEVWDDGIEGGNVKVAVLDTGIDDRHTDLIVRGGWNTVNNNGNYDDRNGHGTHVAGTIAALNTVKTVGVAPAAELYAVKVLNNSGFGTADSIAAGIEWAVQNNMDIINMSLGSSGLSQAVADACKIAYEEGMLLVAAAGNSGNADGIGENVAYPAALEWVIAVAATDESDNRARFSSTGQEVELSAPGVAIYSTYLRDGYTTYNGTSMASPHVAGVAALVWAQDTNLSNADLRALLQNSSEGLGYPNHYGYGMVNAVAAVAAVAESEPPEPAVNVTVETHKDFYAEGEEATITVTVTDENGAAISGLDSDAFTTDINGYDVSPEDNQYIELEADGVYIGSLQLPENDDVEYIVTVTVTDERELTGSGSVTFTHGPQPAEPTTVSVTEINYRARGRHLDVTLRLVDDFGNPVDGATVYIQLYLNGSEYLDERTGTTGSNGTVTFAYNQAPSGTYTTNVTDVTADGVDWDRDTPDNSYTK